MVNVCISSRGDTVGVSVALAPTDYLKYSALIVIAVVVFLINRVGRLVSTSSALKIISRTSY